MTSQRAPISLRLATPALLLAFCSLSPSAPAEPASTRSVTAVVETNEAIFYQMGSAELVRFIPKTEIRVLPFDGPQDPSATSSYWRAGVFFKSIKNRDLAAIHGAWTGKNLATGMLTAGSECELLTGETLRSVTEEVKAKDRDLSAADESAICQFRFRIPNDKVDAVVDGLQKEAAKGTLIKKSLPLKFLVPQAGAALPWAAFKQGSASC